MDRSVVLSGCSGKDGHAVLDEEMAGKCCISGDAGVLCTRTVEKGGTDRVGRSGVRWEEEGEGLM